LSASYLDLYNTFNRDLIPVLRVLWDTTGHW